LLREARIAQEHLDELGHVAPQAHFMPMSLLKAILMHMYRKGWFSFSTTESIAARLRRFRWFREG
jgi:hypothetical protein